MNNQLKPIENWKFNVQILFASLILLVGLFNGIKYIVTEVTGERFWKYNYITSYFTSFLWIAVLIFQMWMFQPYPRIKTLFQWNIIIQIIVLVYGWMERAFLPEELNAIQISSFIESILRLGSMILSFVLYGHMLTRKYNKAPLVTMFRPYATISIFTDVVGFLYTGLLGLATLTQLPMHKLWGVSHFFYTVPLVFLIIYYIKLKGIYPSLQVETESTAGDKPWPPEKEAM